jgi:CHASE3 domain sensor protein
MAPTTVQERLERMRGKLEEAARLLKDNPEAAEELRLARDALGRRDLDALERHVQAAHKLVTEAA